MGNKSRSLFILVGILSLFIFLTLMDGADEHHIKEPLSTEAFVKNHLYDQQGFIKTDLKEQSNVYLSESIGLWMAYLVEKGDKQEFHKQTKVLLDHYMKDGHLIPWRIVDGQHANTNALIDDLRIVGALFKAAEKWEMSQYKELAKKMSDDLATHNMDDQTFINHADIYTYFKGDFLTLSYLDPIAIKYMLDENIISEQQFHLNRDILVNAPLSKNGFFPLTYDPAERTYAFESEVNLIDQYYIGYYRVLWGGDVSSLVQFTKDSLDRFDGVLYGRFFESSKEPSVGYEGASVYALAILMCLEVEEFGLADRLFDQMKQLQISHPESEYDGGYMDLNSLDTHAFDNLLPLIAERKTIDANVSQQ